MTTEEEPRRAAQLALLLNLLYGTCSWSRRGAQGCIGSGKGTRSFVKAFYSSVFRGGGMKAEIKGGWAALSSAHATERATALAESPKAA